MAKDAFSENGIAIILDRSRTALECLGEAGTDYVAPCGGTGQCGKCKVLAFGNDLSPITEEERRFLTQAEIDAGVRLACYLRGNGSCRIHLPVDKGDGLSGWNDAATSLHAAARPMAPDGGREGLGVAVDLGTTKVHAELVDLSDGCVMAGATELNAQIIFGADIMSRLKAACDGKQAALQERIADQLNRMIRKVCRDTGAPREAIRSVCIVGNTAMTHLLAGLPVSQLAHAPYVPFTVDAMSQPASKAGLTACPEAELYIPPAVGGFIGSDHLAMIAATRIERGRGTALGIDIGTNTEIVLKKAGSAELRSISCPSGPAFEGGEISCGMLATPGAIANLEKTPGGFAVRTIGDVPPAGICGSGMLQALHLFHQMGLVSPSGRIQMVPPHVRQNDQGRYIVLVTGASAGRELILTQDDINALLLAKAAIAAGIAALLDHESVAAAAIDHLILAGSFGTHIDIHAAIAIGMLPPLPAGRITKAGNAAAAGARGILISSEYRAGAEQTAGKTRHLELQGERLFRKLFAKAFYIPGLFKGRSGHQRS